MTGEVESTQALIPNDIYEAKIKALVEALLLIDESGIADKESCDQKEAA